MLDLEDDEFWDGLLDDIIWDELINGEKMKNYWVRFSQPTRDYRPKTSPPNENVLGWWCTGYWSNDLDDDIAILCAVVKGVSELDAENSVLKDWPEAIEFEIGETSNLQMGDRYPLNDWMVNRGLIQLGKGNVDEITR